MKCPFCGSENVYIVKKWKMPKIGYDVTQYKCNVCGGLFNHYKGKGRDFVLRNVLQKQRRGRKVSDLDNA